MAPEYVDVGYVTEGYVGEAGPVIPPGEGPFTVDFATTAQGYRSTSDTPVYQAYSSTPQYGG